MVALYTPEAKMLVSGPAPVAEPLQITIAAGWFCMGSDTGQDVESPVHRVWVDSFAMAATQVTVGNTRGFWAQPAPRHHPTGARSTSIIRNNQSSRFPGSTPSPIARGSLQ